MSLANDFDRLIGISSKKSYNIASWTYSQTPIILFWDLAGLHGPISCLVTIQNEFASIDKTILYKNPEMCRVLLPGQFIFTSHFLRQDPETSITSTALLTFKALSMPS